jgi:ABC-type glycerol-3-phosphate transport system permease component
MQSFGKSLIYFILILGGVTMIVPFIWMVSTGLKTQQQVNNGHIGFIPYETKEMYINGDEEREIRILRTPSRLRSAVGDSTFVRYIDNVEENPSDYDLVHNSYVKQVKDVSFNWDNFKVAFNKVPFFRYFLNTIIVAFITLFGVLTTSALAAYAFATMQFKGKTFLFYVMISMMMVPQPIYLIPSYVLLSKIGWIDTFYALIVPWLANIFTIFLLRQQFMTIPKDLFDAASIDGCSRFSMLWRIALPLSKPVIVTSSIFSIIGSWNSFMWPLVMTNSEELRVLQVGLSYFSQESSSQTTLLMAASSFSILPLIVMFLIAQKHIMASIASSGMKG